MLSSALVFLVQICVILAVARLVGFALRALHQPQVMAEIVTGILLGPSLLGWLAPEAANTVFPPPSLDWLTGLGQAGVVLFMFLVGLKLDLPNLVARGRSIVIIAHMSLAVPLILGTALGIALYPSLSDGGSTPTVFALFTGLALGFSALPVLARILEESGLSATPIGIMALAAAAMKDITAWCLLAAVVAMHKGGAAPAVLTVRLLAVALFMWMMLSPVPRALRRLDETYGRRGRLTGDLLGVLLLALAASAWMSDRLGTHALFGALLAGMALPKVSNLASDVQARLKSITAVLLTLFFASTGLRTNFGLIRGTELWVSCGLIVLVAVVGMGGGTTLAARLAGIPWNGSATIGILMNTRGLMEIVVLAVGRDLGVMSPTMFAMMLIMALATTCMTMPLLRWCRLSACPVVAPWRSQPDRERVAADPKTIEASH